MSGSFADIKSHCVRCSGIRFHSVRGKATRREDEGDVWLHEDYLLVICKGCETPSFRHESTFSEDYDHEGNWDTKVTIYPPILARTAREDFDLPRKIELMYKDAITAFNSRLYTLCGVALRAMIESICTDLGVHDGPSSGNSIVRRNTIDGKINGLVEKGKVSTEDAVALHEGRLMGNEAAHELPRLSPIEVGYALDIVEHLMNLSYATLSLSDKAKEVARLRALRNVPKAFEDEDED